MSAPPEIPVIIPVDPIEAIDGLLLDHTPPVVASVNVVVAPIHIELTPLIAGGVNGIVFTVTIFIALELPQVFVTE